MEIYDFGLRLKELRKKKNLSQTKAAERLGLTRSTISAYERNNITPRLEVLLKMATLYDASLDYIVGFEKNPSISLNGLNENQQRLVTDVVERMKQEFLQHP